MKNLLFCIIALIAFGCGTSGPKNSTSTNDCSCDKDSMVIVMRFEIKVVPEKVAFLKQSFDECQAKVYAQEPGCLDYSLYQSYSDSTFFCLTESWATKGDHNAHMELEHTKKHIAETSDIRDPEFESKTSYVYWICPGANEQ